MSQSQHVVPVKLDTTSLDQYKEVFRKKTKKIHIYIYKYAYKYIYLYINHIYIYIYINIMKHVHI